MTIEIGDLDRGYREIDITGKDTTLYSLTCPLFLGMFIVAIPKLTGGRLALVPKNKDGQPLKSRTEALTLPPSGSTPDLLPPRGSVDTDSVVTVAEEGAVEEAGTSASYVARAVVLGAEDFLLRDVSGETYVAAIERVVGGGEPAPDTLFSRIKATLHERLDPKADDVPLTRREYQVLRHLAYGLSNREIARSLSISIETVKEHVQGTLRKLELSNRTEAAVWIVKRGLV